MRLLQAIKPYNEDENERTNVGLHSFNRPFKTSAL